jgi:catechol 2,3-dioxygenase-like lactoylglutathione lyase family enzyme
MIDALDHLTLGVGSVETAISTYETLLGRRASGARLQLANAGLAFERSSDPPGLAAMIFVTPALDRAAHLLERRAVPTEKTGGLLTLSPGATHQVPVRLFERTEKARAPSPLVMEDEAASITALDHVVIRTPDPERAIALYAGRLGLDLRLDRSNPAWGARLLFFRCGDLVVEISHDLKKGVSSGPDRLWGLAWRTPDIGRAHERMKASGIDVSGLRDGRRSGSQVFTVRSHTESVPTLVIGGVGRWKTR